MTATPENEPVSRRPRLGEHETNVPGPLASWLFADGMAIAQHRGAPTTDKGVNGRFFEIPAQYVALHFDELCEKPPIVALKIYYTESHVDNDSGLFIPERVKFVGVRERQQFSQGRTRVVTTEGHLGIQSQGRLTDGSLFWDIENTTQYPAPVAGAGPAPGFSALSCNALADTLLDFRTDNGI